MATYQMIRVSGQVVVFRWEGVAGQGDSAAQSWLRDIQTALEGATAPLYFVSDLRAGYVADVLTLRRLGKLTAHANWGGGMAIGSAVASDLYVNAFNRLAPNPVGDRQVRTLAEVKMALEKLAPGITADVDWEAALPGLV